MFLFVLHGYTKATDPLPVLIGLCRLLMCRRMLLQFLFFMITSSSFEVVHFHGLFNVLISVQGVSVVPLLVIFWPLFLSIFQSLILRRWRRFFGEGRQILSIRHRWLRLLASRGWTGFCVRLCSRSLGAHLVGFTAWSSFLGGTIGRLQGAIISWLWLEKVS
jgi:hypothetical protein